MWEISLLLDSESNNKATKLQCTVLAQGWGKLYNAGKRGATLLTGKLQYQNRLHAKMSLPWSHAGMPAAGHLAACNILLHIEICIVSSYSFLMCSFVTEKGHCSSVHCDKRDSDTAVLVEATGKSLDWSGMAGHTDAHVYLGKVCHAEHHKRAHHVPQ